MKKKKSATKRQAVCGPVPRGRKRVVVRGWRGQSSYMGTFCFAGERGFWMNDDV